MSQAEKSKKPVIVAQIMGKWIGGGVESVIMNYYRHLDHTKVQFDFICDEDSTRIPYDEIKKLGGRVFLVPKYQKLPQYLKALEGLFRKNQYRIVHSNVNTLSVFHFTPRKRLGYLSAFLTVIPPVTLANGNAILSKIFYVHLAKNMPQIILLAPN